MGDLMKIKQFLKENFTTKKLTFLMIFAILALISQRINFSALVGAENQYLTVFNFFAPIAGIFLGPIFGIAAVLLAEIANNILRAMPWTVLNMSRLIPILLATFYFGTRNKNWQQRLSIIIPVLAIIAFVLHPVGRTVWFFGFYMAIPLLPYILPKKWGQKLFLKSLGSTFTAYAIGTALWIWTIPMTRAQWLVLVPQVAFERLLFASGIMVSYIVFNTLLAKLDEKFTTNAIFIDKDYILGNKSKN